MVMEDKVMKILHFVWGILLVLMVGACSDDMDRLTVEENQLLLNFTASFEENSDSRTALIDGQKVEWLQGDKIVLFDGESSATYVASTTGPKTTFVFESGDELSSNKTFSAIYPASAVNVADKSIQVKKEQVAVAGGFDPDAAICLATVFPGKDVVTFKNACALLKFNLAPAFAENARAMVVSSANGVVNQGVVSADGTIGWGEAKDIQYRLSGTFSAEDDYYLLVAPQTFSTGFSTVLLDGASLAIDEGRSTEKSITFEASKVYTLGEIRHIMPDYEWYYGVLAQDPNATEFVIRTPEEMMAFIDIVNSLPDQTMRFAGKTVKLGNDINMEKYKGSIVPVDGFGGTFDGQNYKIKNLYIESKLQYVGLFSQTHGTSDGKTYAIIKNLVLEGGTVKSNFPGAYNKSSCVGAFVGNFAGRLINCHNRGCEVVGGDDVDIIGGIVGYSNSSAYIMGCSNSAQVGGTALINFKWAGATVGGIIGYAHQMGGVAVCYNVGKVYGTQLSGGIVGYCYESGVYGSYNEGEILVKHPDDAYYTPVPGGQICAQLYATQKSDYWGRYWAYWNGAEHRHFLLDFNVDAYAYTTLETLNIDEVVRHLNSGIGVFEENAKVKCPSYFKNDNGTLSLVCEE